MHYFLSAISIIFLVQIAHAQGQQTHCARSESIYFNCQIKGSKKIASLCASEPKDDFKGYIQYRFGSIGKVEFKFPESTNEQDMLNRFYAESGRTVDFSLHDAEISFINNDYAYRLYYSKSNQSGKWEESSEVMVWNVHQRDKVKSFECKNPSAGKSLPPDHIISNNSSKNFKWSKQIW